MRRIGITRETRLFQTGSASTGFTKRSTTVLVITLVGLGMLALLGRTGIVRSGAQNTVQAAGRGEPYFHLQDGREMQVAYRGEESLIRALRSGGAQPRSMASIDFDRNGTPDLVAGYGYNGTGLLTIQRGNPDAFAPQSDDVFVRINQGYNPDSLLPAADVIQIPESVDYLQVGDFNHDNQPDALVAASGGGLFLLAGDARGGLHAPEQIALSGPITAMAAGEFRAPDGWTDVAVGIAGASGPQLLIFDGVSGVAGEPMRLKLSAAASAITFGEVDTTPFMGIAVSSGSQIQVVHGWGRKQSPTLESRVETIDAGANVRGLAIGYFIWSREGNMQIAALNEGGTLNILQRGKPNTQPFNDEELWARARLRQQQQKTKVDVEALPGWGAAKAERWTSAREVATGNVAGANATSQNLLQRAHVSFVGTEDLFVLGANQQKLDIVRQVDAAYSQANVKTTAGDMVLTSLSTAAAPATVLALPQKLNGERSLLLLQAGSAAPTVVPLAPTATITVDRTDDPNGGALAAASACTVAANDCSLRGAVQFANIPVNAGTVISLVTNTYLLSTNGTNGCTNAGETNATGDLEVNQSTTFTGNGAANTIVRQAAATNDRVICMDVPLTAGLTYSFSGMTITGGRDVNSNVGGGGFIGGARNVNTNLTNMVFANNQTTGPNISGGGGVAVTGGSMNVTGCTFGAANLPAANRNDLTLGNASNSNSAGGLSYSPGDPAGVGGATGTLTVGTTTFTHNTSSSGSAGGGGLDVFTFNLSTGTANIATSTFSLNQAVGTASGGGINNESLNNVNISTTSFTSNSAGNRGGGVYVGGGAVLFDGTTPSITFTGNTAVSGGTSVSTASSVNVAGTNTSLAGSIEISGNGIWTNNAGSALAPTDVVIAGGTFNCNNSTTNVGGNFSLGPSGNNVIPGTFNGNTGTVTVAGTFTYNNVAGTAFNAGTGTFNFNGTGVQSISNNASITFNNLTDSNVTQPLTFNNSFAVNGTLNINGANAILAPVAAAVISGSGTLNGTGTARVTRTAAIADFSSQYTMTTKTISSMTVEYRGAAAQSVSALTYNNLTINNANGVTLAAGTTTVNGTLTLTAGAMDVAASTLVINNGTSVAAGTLASSSTGTVNYNQGSNGQNVLAGGYGNLTFSNFSKVLASTGTIFVSGTFTPGSGGPHTITLSTFNFNGFAAQTVPAFNYNDLTISGPRTINTSVTLANGGTIGVAGTFSPTATFGGTGGYIITNNTIDFNGTAAQTVSAFNYHNLTISGNKGGGAVTFANGGTVGVASTFSPIASNNTYVVTNNTFTFNGSAAQSIPIFTFNNLTINNGAGVNLAGAVTVGGALTLTSGALGVGTNTLTLNGAASATAGTLTSGTTGTVNYNQGSNGQATVLAANYGNLTFSNFNKTLASTGTIGIAGTFTPGTATGHTIAGSTINFNGASPQTIPGFTYQNLTSSGGAVARTLDPVNTIKIAGVFTPGTNVYTITGSTIEYNGAGVAQTLPPTFTTYNNLTLNNVAGTSGFAGLTVNGLIRVQAGTFTSSSQYNNVQIDVGATLAATAGSTISVSGNWTNNGTFTPSTGTVVFNGNGNTQTIAGTNTFNNLTSNHIGAGGVTASGSSLTVTGLMLIQAGTFTSSSTFNNVQIESGATLASDGGTMNVSGNWTNNGGTFTPNGNTVNFNGSVAQAINGTALSQTFNNVTVNKSALALSTGGSTTSVSMNNLTMTLGTFTAPANLDINGNTVLNGGTLTSGTSITAAGNWTKNAGAFTAGAGTVAFDGAAAQAIGGTTVTTFNGLTIANAGAGVSLTQSETVNGTLTLTNDLTTGANTLTQPNTAPGLGSAGAGDVIGNVKRTGFVNAACVTAPCANTLSFGNPNNQITMTVAPTPADITINLVKTAPAGFTTAVQRTYTITPNPSNLSGFTATLRLHYLDGELNGNSESTLQLRRFNGTGWQAYPATVPVDTVNNWVENNAVHNFSAWTLSACCVPTATDGVVSGRVSTSDGAAVVGAVVNLSGSQSRKTITDRNGNYRFDKVDTNGFYTVTPQRSNYDFSPASRSFSQVSNQTEAGFTGTSLGDNLNPLDTAEYFVRQQYVDILGREPDEAGFNYWSDQINACAGDADCTRTLRTGVAAAFFIESEFKQSGAFIYNLYQGALDRGPLYSEYSADRRNVVGGPTLEAQKQAFVAAFVARAEFSSRYESNTTAESFVDALLANVGGTGVDLSNLRDSLIGRYNTGGSQAESRTLVVRDVTESAAFRDANYNEAFVGVEYFGYLQRTPERSGYEFWVNVLNTGDPGNYRGMVCSFITSREYQLRFSSVVSRSNNECGR
jgi:hypothetical protein